MRKILFLMSLASLSLVFSCQKAELDVPASEAVGGADGSGSRVAYVNARGAEQGVVRVKFKRGSEPKAAMLSATGAYMGVERVDKVSSQFAASSMTRVFPYAGKHEAKHVKHGLDLWYEIRFDTQTAALQNVVAAYSELSDVIDFVETSKPTQWVDNSPVVPYDEMLNGFGGRSAATVAAGVIDVLPFNDEMLIKQWDFDYVNTSAVQGSGMDIFTAWEVTAGARDVIVSIVDGGIAYNHEDLKDNVWVNEAEMNGAEGVDDDKNGYIDDKRGWDFYSGRKDINGASHGTHVAGTVAAVSNNGVGVSGIAGGTGNGDGVRIMSCAIGDDNGTAMGDRAAAAIVYGADNGAVISQNSWGYITPDMREKVVEDAIDYFIAEAGNATDFPNSPMRGGVVFFAAGNNGTPVVHYPAAYESAICVAATNHLAKRGTYSNYSNKVAISAQGGDQNLIPMSILSTIPGDEKYGYKWGTSMACPHVSGVAALLVAANRGITNAELKTLILSSVRSLEGTESDWKLMGSGLLNAAVHLTPADDKTAPGIVSDLAVVEIEGGAGYGLSWSVPIEKGHDRVTSYMVYYSQSPFVSLTDSGVSSFEVTGYKWLPSGAKITHDMREVKELDMNTTGYYFAIVAADRWGNASGLSNVVEHSALDADELAISATVTRGVLKVMWGKGFVGTKRVVVYDVVGRAVISTSVQSQMSKVELNVANLSSGNYIVKVTADGDGTGGGHDRISGSAKFRKL